MRSHVGRMEDELTGDGGGHERLPGYPGYCGATKSLSEFCRFLEVYSRDTVSEAQNPQHSFCVLRKLKAVIIDSLLFIWAWMRAHLTHLPPPSMENLQTNARTFPSTLIFMSSELKFCYWNASLIGSFNNPLLNFFSVHSTQLSCNPDTGRETFPKGNSFTLVLLPQFCFWQLLMELGGLLYRVSSWCCRTYCYRGQRQSLAWRRRWLSSQSPNKNLADMLHCLLCAQ